MPLVKRITTYSLGNETFRDLKKVKVHVENKIGSIIDMVEPRLTPKQALDLLELLKTHRLQIVDLLTTEVPNEDCDYESTNIFEV